MRCVPCAGRRRRRRAARQPGRRRLTRRRSALAHRRGARSAWNRGSLPLAGAGRRSRASRGSRSTSATSRPATTTGSRCGRPHRAHPRRLGRRARRCRSYRGREVMGFAQDDTGVDVELSDGTSLRARVPRRLRRRAQPDPQGSRHRLPRVGPVDELPDRRGRDGRGAGVRHPPDGGGIHALGGWTTGSRVRVV